MALKKAENKYDYAVAVIGGGPAGIMAAIQASSPEHGQGACPERSRRVVLLEKNSSPAKKLLLTGGGRCNLANAEYNLRELVKNYNNGEFLFHAFSVFGPKETINFFEELGVKIKTENPSTGSGQANRVFPASNDAKEVLEALKKYLEKNKVTVLFNSEVVDVKKVGKKISKLILANPSTGSGRASEIIARKYILCAGGKSHPVTGSDGFGYKFAEKLGHTIIKPMPALSPILVKEAWARNLQRISLEDVKINVLQNNKKIISEEGEFLFTHVGISGPVILNISATVGELLEKGAVKISFDLFPLLNHEQLLKGFEYVLKQHNNKTAKNILTSFVPERLAEVLLDISGLDKNSIANNLSKINREKLIKILKNFEVTAEEVLGFNTAMTTRGGISLKEINHKTMRSKIIDNLFFAGEIIDVDGKSGGFNLQMCWTTGRLAGGSCK